MKTVTLELTDTAYERWLSYKKKNGFTLDSGALLTLLEELRYSEQDILNIVQDTVMTIVDMSGVPSKEQLENLPFLTHYLCDCEKCMTEKGWAHTDMKGSIAVSRKHFTDMLQHNLHAPIGLLDLIHSYIHEVMHNVYPNAPRKRILGAGYCSTFVRKKTEEIWCKGMLNVSEVLADDGNRSRSRIIKDKEKKE